MFKKREPKVHEGGEGQGEGRGGKGKNLFLPALSPSPNFDASTSPLELFFDSPQLSVSRIDRTAKYACFAGYLPCPITQFSKHLFSIPYATCIVYSSSICIVRCFFILVGYCFSSVSNFLLKLLKIPGSKHVIQQGIQLLPLHK